MKRRNWKATLSCLSLEKHINSTTLLQHIKKPHHQIHSMLFVEPFDINCSTHTQFPQQTLYSESFSEIFETLFLFKTFYKLELKPPEVMLYIKYGRQKSVNIDCRNNVLAVLIGILKVVVSVERDEYN